MNKLSPQVDAYVRRIKKWHAETGKLRAILLDSGSRHPSGVESRMLLRSVVLLLLAASLSSCSQDLVVTRQERTEEETAALMAVQQFFETMTAKDSRGARAVLDPEGDFVSVRWNDDGERVVRRTSNEVYLAGLEGDAEAFLERMWASEVRVHGPIAVVWTPYDFHVNGEFSHCGVDAFQLLLTEGGWMITGGTYTVERTGCPESPHGSPNR